MPAEAATYIHQLDASLPGSNDLVREGDDHVRLLKATLKATFPGVAGAVTPTHTEINYLAGVTSAIQTQIAGKASLSGATYTGTHDLSGAAAVQLPANTTIGSVTAAQIGYLAGASSSIQTQLDGKSTKSGSTYTGTHDFTSATMTAATPSVGDATTKVATTAFVAAMSFSSVLPGQSGNNGKFLTTDGTNASWGDTPSLVPLQNAVDLLNDVPIVTKTSDYTLALGDRGRCISTTANVTIPANASVAFPVGAVVVIRNRSASATTINITSDTLRQSGTTKTGTRTIAAYGTAQLHKDSATVWYVSGDVS